MGIKLATDEIRYIGLFESMTGATVKDCLFEDNKNKIVYVVKEGDMGLAIGKNGANAQRVKETLNKSIDIIEYSEDPVKFIKNIIWPVKVKSIHVSERRDGKKIAVLDINKKDKGLVIGKEGKNIDRIKNLLKRHHNLDDIMIM
ncbi:MAG TPA: NusA-like transcription termination signal-binding factor [Methanofastidiosum sp.]|jgi:N utilization substance protein A|nr:NusA-like transcription termination signal-binding factor [Methanofastidiosum sp.]HNZ87605.1 NusA-like transcription termination signal-binding factor [Methanofastidiosum sp.]HOC78463.1 NusA-like transcription termination signal-binding factor [Methanofastidiosum sp.]HOG74005.1 NusA-like transcription termination signal-binding factor [Methanofastidiosum sp.]HPA49639.1 NusA-like transcription termination signal-binding factor [Methanofastidiosum sp.]